MISNPATLVATKCAFKKRALKFAAAVALTAVALSASAQFSISSSSSRVGSVVTTPRVKAELVAMAAEGIAPGRPIWLGLQLSHIEGWHTYWKNPGDSGLPTELQWTLPKGVSAGDIAWPIPHKFPIGTLANYGYTGTVLLPVPMVVSPDFKPSINNDITVNLHATWLVCSKECIPEEGNFELRIPANVSTATNASEFMRAMALQPTVVKGESTVAIEGKTIRVTAKGLPASLRGKDLGVFPETPEVIETAATPKQSWSGADWSATIPVSDHRSNSPKVMPIVLTLGDKGYRIEAKVDGNWIGTPKRAEVSPALTAALNANAASSSTTAAPTTQPIAPTGTGTVASMARTAGAWTTVPSFIEARGPLDPIPSPLPTFLLALLGAVLGGVILNLMPCVFPILAIKVLTFANTKSRASMLSYAVGVVVSFLALGAAMLALREAGEQLGWGFQLQSPWVVAALAAMFTLIGLNLLGVFRVGNVVPNRVAATSVRNESLNSFLSGVLAVAIAAPCTAPFMGASLGLAIGLPAWQAMLIFAALGIGMAIPYIVASVIPGIAKVLPRPGQWMEVFRRFMAFPMFATVVWLVWVLGQQSGIDGAGTLLVLLVALSAVVWSFGLPGLSRAFVGLISIAVFSYLAASLGGNINKPAESPIAQIDAGERWQPWSVQRVQTEVASGRSVFVDFTAAWCVTCQYNKKATLTDPAVMNAFDAKKVTLLRADWTRRDPEISKALTAMGRSGVPVYAYYKPGSPPILLSEIISKGDIEKLLD